MSESFWRFKSAIYDGLIRSVRLDCGTIEVYPYDRMMNEPKPTKRKDAMNYSTAVFLINRDVRAIVCQYENDGKKVSFKTLDASIKKDDLVVVPTGTRHGFTVVKVTDDQAQPDLDSSEDLKWIVSKVDRTTYEKIVADEAVVIETVKRAEFAKKRREMFASVADAERDEFKALELYKNGDVPKS